jgi:hypothetical protein
MRRSKRASSRPLFIAHPLSVNRLLFINRAGTLFLVMAADHTEYLHGVDAKDLGTLLNG